MKLRRQLAVLLFCCSPAIPAASAQALVQEQYRAEVMQAFERAPKQSSLPCEISVSDFPRLDFLFRYVSGYAMSCKLKDPLAPGTQLHALLRITPQQASPILMVENFSIPQLPEHNASSLYSKPNQLQLASGGGFALGPGKYRIEVLLIDEHNHSLRTEKTLTAHEDSSRVSSTLQPGAVAPLMFRRWNGTLAGKGPRVTILMNVFNQGRTARLQAWEIADLMQSLDSLLRQVPFQSVKLIAFDLDRQQVVFQEDSFDANGFSRLERSLRNLNLLTISAQSLKQGAWLTYLLNMTRHETESTPTPDALIFLGEWGSHNRDRFSKETFQGIENSRVRAFNLSFFNPFGLNDDAIDKLTMAMRGKNFHIYSPESLADTLKKLTAQLTDENSK